MQRHKEISEWAADESSGVTGEIGGGSRAGANFVASTQRSSAELTNLRAEVERLSKENKKLAKQACSMHKQLQLERQRSRSKEEPIKELSMVAVESDSAHVV
jgi:hypothetical protein